MPDEFVKIKIIKGTICGGKKVRPNPNAENKKDRFPEIDAIAKDARLLMLTGFAEPASDAAAKLVGPIKR